MRVVTGTRAWLGMAAALAALVAAQGATLSLDRLIDAVMRNGPDSQLPAHLSVMLGVSPTERTIPVKQAVARDGAIVRTFNVSVADHDAVVLMTYNEQSHSTKAYLSSAAGKLRKAVSYQAGAAAHERSLTDAHGDFASEIKFWMDFGKPKATPQP